MLIAIPVCHKDVELVLKNLAWCDKLGAPYQHDALVTHDDTFDASSVIEEAKKRFKSVKECVYTLWRGEPQGWPGHENRAWQSTARFIESHRLGPWLWWEADATPLKPGWVDTLANEYAAGGKPFMGYIVDEYDGHMNGVAVYPDDISTYTINGLLCRAAPFDIVMRDDIRKNVYRANHLIHWTAQSVTFRTPEQVKSTVKSTAVLFHKCKDGTLIEQLSTPPTLLQRIGIKRKSKPATSRRPFCFLVLGRYGDLTNLLPVFQRRYDGTRVPVVISKEFVSMFDGVSYVEPIVLDIPPDKLDAGFEQASELFEHVQSLQVYGNSAPKSHFEAHYNRDAWLMAGEEAVFKDRSIRPLFDGRSPRRESELVKQFASDGRPVMAMAVQGGYSSPFRNYKIIENLLRKHYGDQYQIVDLCGIKADRLYDVIGIIEQASVLVTADSVHLHLAAATDTPTVALLSDRTFWAQSEPRCNTILAFDYRKASSTPEMVIDAIAKVTPRPTVDPQPVIVHAVEQHPEGKDEHERNKTARLSWMALYNSKRVVAAHFNEPYLRDGRCVGAEKPVPFLKDVLKHAMDNARMCDVVMWTNADTIIEPSVIDQIHAGLAKAPIVTMRRLDHATRKPHLGRDLCAFRMSWLSQHWKSMPDFLLGYAEFDNWMAVAARLALGKSSTAKQIFDDWQPTDLVPGGISHIAHDAAWDDSDRYTNAANLYNVKLFKQWCTKNKAKVKFDKRGHVDWSK